MRAFKSRLTKLLRGAVHKWTQTAALPCPADFDAQAVEIVARVRPFTQTSPERLFALIQATRYVVAHRIPGDIVECGVWKGGSMMAVAIVLQELGDTDRRLFLCDTFEGMTAPTAFDVSQDGMVAADLLRRQSKDDEASIWCRCELDAVVEAMQSTGYPGDRIEYVRGRVEDTLPGAAPPQIALLRLDTDWYESTLHEMECLYPHLVPAGVLIIDDYGHWQGARRAVDEYLAQHHVPLLLNRIDYTGRIGVKTGE